MKPKRQVAALPYRRRDCGTVEVCLVTTRQTRRWVIPKGWPQKGRSDWKAAAAEAFEEAGLRGTVKKKNFGAFPYWKRMDDHFQLVDAQVYLLEVDRELADWPERDQRERHWFTLPEAMQQVLEPGLVAILKALEDRLAPPASSQGPGAHQATGQGAADNPC